MFKKIIVSGTLLFAALSIAVAAGFSAGVIDIDVLKPAANKKVIVNDGQTNVEKKETQEDGQEESMRKTQLNDAAGNQLEGSTYVNVQGVEMIVNPDNILVLVNKKRNLPSDWEPKDMAVPNVKFSFSGDAPRKYMRKEAAAALEKLFEQAEKDGMNMAATSGYRSYDTQKRIFSNNAKLYGEKEANKTSAYPGQSEHQTGLAMDITSAEVGFKLVQSFGDTDEGKWLRDNAADFGFIIRYLKEKEEITGYSYEPWHVRYVGKEVAKDVMSRGITLEEYFGQVE